MTGLLIRQGASGRQGIDGLAGIGLEGRPWNRPNPLDQGLG